MPKKQILKGSSLSVRLPDKTRYGLDLAARQSRVPISGVLLRAIDDLLERVGITARIDDDVATLLDRVWSESESDRIKLLGEHAPMLMTPAEKVELSILKAISGCGHDLLEYLHDHGLLWELLAPGISDTFADDVLPGCHGYRTTAELKQAARELDGALNPR